MAAITQGTTCLYGIAGTVTNLYVQSYSVSSAFNVAEMVMDENGITKTWRGDDRKSELSLEGVCKTGTVPVLGASITFTVHANTAYGTTGSTSYVGWVTKIDEKGGNKEFTKVSITAEAYEGITPA